MAMADAHVHLDFMSNHEEVMRQAGELGIGLFANTVTPRGCDLMQATCERQLHVHLGVGLHPWWVADERCNETDVAHAAELASAHRWIGEVGLDFSPKHTNPSSKNAQVQAFTRIMEACSRTGDKVISLHSVRAASEVLRILEETGCTQSCTCVFHWFSGSTEDLWHAIRAGCWFSINERQARTRRAREQLKLIPTDRLLLETDDPPGEGIPFSAEQIAASLERARDLLQDIRGEELGDQIAANWRRLES